MDISIVQKSREIICKVVLVFLRVFGTTKVVPCYKAGLLGSFQTDAG